MRLPSLAISSGRRTYQLLTWRNNWHSCQSAHVAVRHKSTSSEHHVEPEDPWADNKPYKPPPRRRGTLDDFPVPQGSWQEYYDEQQKHYKFLLAFGASCLIGTVAYIWYKDPFKFGMMLGPYKYMKNPPAFSSPTLEPRFDAEFWAQITEEELLAAKDKEVQSAQKETVTPTSKLALPKETVSKPAPALPKETISKPVPAPIVKSEAKPEESAIKTPVHVKEEVPSKRPLTSAAATPIIPAIPNHVPYLIIGGGTAAFSAFRAIRASDPTSTVLVVTEDAYYPYMRPPLTKELWYSDDTQKSKLKFRQMNGKERSIFFEHDEFFVDPVKLSTSENGGVAVLMSTRVTKLDSVEQKVTLANGMEIHYDRCLLATGASPRPLSVLEKGGSDLMKHVTLYRGVDSFKEVDTALKTAKKVLVIGGGFLGSELACSLARQGEKSGLEVMQIFPEKGNLGRVLPEYLSEWLTRKLQIVDGVKVYPEKYVKSAKLSSEGVTLILSDDEQVVADHVIVAVGVSPNTDLAAGAGLEVDEEHGGFRVNSELQACSNLWVAGDAASYFDITLGRRRIEHHDHAVATGRIAGENMLGKGKPFWHQSMFWSDIGPEIGFEAVGLIDSSLETVAVFARPEPDEVVDAPSETTVTKWGSNGYTSFQKPNPRDDYRRGVIFYLKDKIIVGVLLWNIFSHISLARKVVKDQKTFGDLGELAKLFSLHNEDTPADDNSEAAGDKNSSDSPA